MHVGDLLAEVLIHGGVRHVFGVPGGQTRPLYDAIHDRRPAIQHVLVRDERSGIYAADAYARISGGLGVCDATVGPGATNLVSGLAEAFNSSVPVLAIVADIPRGWEHLRPFGNASQGFFQRQTLEPVTKAYVRVDAPQTAAMTIRLAMRTALSGRRGPVVLEIPDDVFAAECPEWRPPLGEQQLDHPVAGHDDLRHAADVLTGAQRPIIVAGSGAVDSGAWDEVAAVAESLGAPVLTSITGKGVIADDHPLAGGVTGVFGQTGANDLFCEADVVFAIGAKLGQLTTFSWSVPRRDQHLVHLDIDAGEIGRVFEPDVRLVGDARATLLELLELLPPEPAAGPRSTWGAMAVDRARSTWRDYNAGLQPESGAIDPRSIVAAISAVLGPDDVLVSDASLSSGWGAAYFTVRRAGRRFVAPRGLAGIGWGGPAALGVQAAVGPERRVVCLAGDGAWGYSLSEVETAVRHQMPVLFVVLNNGMLAWIHHGLLRNGKVMSSEFGPADYAAAARAFGAEGRTVGPGDDLTATLREGLATRRPVVVDVHSSQVLSPVLRAPAQLGSGAEY